MSARRVHSEIMSLASADPPRRHQLTVSDYYRMAEVGIIAPDARVELIDGSSSATEPEVEMNSRSN